MASADALFIGDAIKFAGFAIAVAVVLVGTFRLFK